MAGEEKPSGETEAQVTMQGSAPPCGSAPASTPQCAAQHGPVCAAQCPQLRPTGGSEGGTRR